MKRIITLLLSAFLVFSASGLSVFADSYNYEDDNLDFEYKIVLTWNQSPRDLDSHLIGDREDGTQYHVYFSQKNAYEDGNLIANLDVDDTTSYGPEHTTVFKTADGGVYHYYVHNWSGESSLRGCGAKVRVYKKNTIIGAFTVPEEGYDASSEYWDLLKIKDGKLYVINRLIDSNPANGGSYLESSGSLQKNDITINARKLDNNTKGGLLSGIYVRKSIATSDSYISSSPYVIKSNENINYSLTIKKDGRQNYVIPKEVLLSWKGAKTSGSSPKYTHTAYIPELINTPYISTVFAQNYKGVYYDAAVSKVKVYDNEGKKVIVSSSGTEGKTVTYYLEQDASHKLSNSTGVFSTDDIFSKFKFDKKIVCYLKTTVNGKDYISKAVDLKLEKAQKASSQSFPGIENEKYSLLGKSFTKYTIPSNIPIFGGSELKFDAFSLPAGVDIDGDTLRIVIGTEVFNSEEDDEVKSNYFRDLKKTCKSIKELHERGLNNYIDSKIKEFRKKYSDGKKAEPSKGPLSWSIEPLGYIEGEFINGRWVIKEAFLEIDGKVKADFKGHVVTPVGPLCASIETSAEIIAKAGGARATSNPDLPLEFDLEFSIAPGLEIFAGYGVDDVANVGVYGDGKIPFEYNCPSKYFRISVNGSFGIRAQFFCFKGDKELWNGSRYLLNKRLGASALMAANMRSVYGSEEESFDFDVISRDYLSSTSRWHSSRPLMVQKAFASSPASMDMVTLQSNVFPYSDPKIVTIGDKVFLTWIEDDSTRDDYNRMRLMYSVYDKNRWSDPKPIYDNDDFNDKAPEIVTDGKNVYIAWQKTNKVVKESDNSSLAALCNKVELYYAKYNLETGEITEEKRVTDNSLFEYNYRWAMNQNTPVLYYATNNATDDSYSNCKLYKWTNNDGSILVKSGIDYVLGIAASFSPSGSESIYLAHMNLNDYDKSSIEKISKSDGNTSTYSTSNIFKGNSGTICSKIFSGKLGNQSATFVVKNNELSYYCNGEWKNVPIGDKSVNSDVLLANNTKGCPTLYWVSEGYNELGVIQSAVCATSYIDNAWTEPVELARSNVTLSGLTLAQYNGEIVGLTDRLYDDETADLTWISVSNAINDVEIKSISVGEDGIFANQDNEISVLVKNNGTEEVNALSFYFGDEKQNIIHKDVSLQSGEEKFVQLTYSAPDNISNSTLELHLDGDDANVDNNYASIDIGQYIIELSDAKVEELTSEYVVSAIITNNSDVRSDDILVISKMNGEVLDSSYIDRINARESREIEFTLPKDEIEYIDGIANISLEECFSNNEAIAIIEECHHTSTHVESLGERCTTLYRNTICDNCNAVIDCEMITGNGHKFVDGECVQCGIKSIKLNENCAMSKVANEYIFVPNTSDEYFFVSDAKANVYGRICDEKGEILYETDPYDSSDIWIGCYLEKGRVYYLDAFYSSSSSINAEKNVVKLIKYPYDFSLHSYEWYDDWDCYVCKICGECNYDEPDFSFSLRGKLEEATTRIDEIRIAKSDKEVAEGTQWVTSSVMNQFQKAIAKAEEEMLWAYDEEEIEKIEAEFDKALASFNKSIKIGKAIAVTNIELDEEDIQIGAKGSCVLKPDVNDDATEPITYTSTDTNVAKVDAKGKVTGVGVGVCQIVLETTFCQTSVTVRGVNSITALKSDKTKISMAIGESDELNFVVSDKNGDAVYNLNCTSLDEKYVEVINVDENTFRVVAKNSSVKTTKLVFTDTVSGKKVTVSVSIGLPADQVTTSMKSTELGLVKGKSTTLKATAAREDKQKPIATTVTWESDDESVATVDAKGKVVAVGKGTATITARATAGASAKPCVFTVRVVDAMIPGVQAMFNDAKTTKVSLANDGSSAVVKLQSTKETAGAEWNYTAAETIAKGKEAYVKIVQNDDEFTLTPTQYALTQLEETGKNIAAKVVFTDTISGKSTTVTVNIGLAAELVTTTAKSTELGLVKGKNTTLKATAARENTKQKPIDTAVTWTSSDTLVATVDAKGKVVAVGKGTATITAKAVAGKDAEVLKFNVTVVEAMIPGVQAMVAGVKATKATLALDGELTVSLQATKEVQDADWNYTAAETIAKGKDAYLAIAKSGDSFTITPTSYAIDQFNSTKKAISAKAVFTDTISGKSVTVTITIK